MEAINLIWKELEDHKNTQLYTLLEEKIVLPNVISQNEYTLTQRCVHSTNAFIGIDLDGNTFHIRILPCSSYDHIKVIHHNLAIIQENCQKLQLVEVKDMFEYCEANVWMAVIVSEFLNGFTLEDFWGLMATVNPTITLPKEFCIYIFLKILDLIEEADKIGMLIGSLMPNTVIIYKDRNSPDLPNFESYKIKIALSSKPSSRSSSKFNHLFMPTSKRNLVEYEIWGAGISLYSLIGTQPLDEIKGIQEATEENLHNILPIRYKDPALTLILKKALKDSSPQTIFQHTYTQVWKGLLSNDQALIQKAGLNDVQVLVSGLLFDIASCRIRSLRRLLEIALDHSSEVSHHLKENEAMSAFLKSSAHFDWDSYPNLINALFMVLAKKLPSQTFKESMVSEGFFQIIPSIMANRVSTHVACNFINGFMDKNTLTILQIITDIGFVEKLFFLGSENPELQKFITSTMPYYGFNAIAFIERAYTSLKIPKHKAMQHLFEVPYYFKLENWQQMVKFISSLFTKKSKLHKIKEITIEMLKNVVKSVGEILILPGLLQSHYKKGCCLSHSDSNYLSYQTKNPILIECNDCKIIICTICASLLHQNHNTRYIHYFQEHFRCCCQEEHGKYDIGDATFTLPKYDQYPLFVLSNGAAQESNIFTSIGDIMITTFESIAISSTSQIRAVIAYFEVKVHKAGFQENITIGLKGTGISYCSCAGSIYYNSQEVGRGPRFGSYDTVGMGLMRNSQAFISYNGVIVYPLIDCTIEAEIKPFVILKGENCEIEFKLKDWMLQQSDISNLNAQLLEKCDYIFVNLVKRINKLMGRENNEREGLVELVDKFKELLVSIGQNKYLKKLHRLPSKL